MHPLAANIDALRRRLVWRERLVALCRVLAAAIAVACLLGVTDYFVRFADRGLRVMITAALLAAIIWAAYRWWWLPRRRRPGRLAVARRVEAAFPQLRDRLASALEFLSQAEDDPTAGSATLRRAVVADADLAVAQLPLDRLIDGRPLRRAASWAAVAIAVVVALLLLYPAAVRTALARLAVPWGNTEWPRAHHLEFFNPPTRLAAGDAFEVELADRDGTPPEQVRIEYRFQRDGRREVQSEWMTRVGDVFVARRGDVRESFAFRAEGGDDHTMPWHTVEVVEPPRLESLAVVAHPPPYTGLPATPAEGHLRVLAGTGIELRGVASEPLGAARVHYGDATLEAAIGADDTGRERRAFAVQPADFIAAESGPFRLELANGDGVAGAVGQWNLRVEPDPPPRVAWLEPQQDLFVLPTATVPLVVDVRDNLAIADVALEFTRSDQPDAEPQRIEIARGPATPPPRAPDDAEDARRVGYDWSLAERELPVGTQLVVHATAADYRPGVGRTVTPRRITIISRDELDARLADRQAQLARHLDELQAAQQRVRDDVRTVEIQLRDVGRLNDADAQTLAAAELGQRRVARSLADEREGVPALAAALAAELRMNGIADSETLDPLESLRAALRQLAAGPVAQAEQSVAAARKLADAGRADAAVRPPLTEAARAQDQALRELEALRGQLSGWADLGRLVRDLAQLREDQLAHLDATRQSIGLDTLPLELRELGRDQRAALNKASAAEEALTRRFERIDEGLQTLSRELAERDPDAAGRAGDAAALARERGVAANMHQSVRDLAANRVGQALVREARLADDMQAMLDVLRSRGNVSPEELIERLKAAEQELAHLRGELAKLRDEIADTERAPAPDARQLQQLRQRQQQLREQIGRLARELARLDAADAGRSAGQAADKLADRDPQRPAESRQVEQAERDLAEAARQLAQRRAQAEEDWARKFLERFQAALAKMLADQKKVVASTEAVEQARGDAPLDDAQATTVAELAATERRLADDARVHAELIAGLRVFGAALGDASRELATAAGLLDHQATGPRTQAAERRALARFEQIAWALEQTAQAQQQQQPPDGAGNAGGGQQPRPLFDLFEVKLLRMLQADLQTRTEEFQHREAADAPLNAEQQAALAREADVLAAEQAQLAELVAELIARNNEAQEER